MIELLTTKLHLLKNDSALHPSNDNRLLIDYSRNHYRGDSLFLVEDVLTGETHWEEWREMIK